MLRRRLMIDSGNTLLSQYAAAVEVYLKGGDEGALLQAYALGRSAWSGGIGVLDLVGIHHDAIGALIAGRRDDFEGDWFQKGGAFLAEALSSFEMALGGYKEANEKLQRYRLLADITSDIILFIDRVDLTVVEANAAALAAYGYERSRLVGSSLRMLKPENVAIEPEMLKRTDTESGALFEMVHLRSDGTTFPVEIFARGAVIDGRRILVVTARDITERRHAAEQIAVALHEAVQASHLKSEFVATMSHEIRTPMHGVIGMSELLLTRPLGPLEREYATTLKESAQALLTVIDDILDFSKLEAHKLELEEVAIDPVQVVAGVINLLRGAARSKKLALNWRASTHVPATVRGDATRLRQILMNLVGNAVKFTASGEVTVSTSVERDDSHSVVLKFAVSDTGIGVAPESRERLFDAFVQGEGGTTRKFGGTGLGLTISRRLVELMGGQIWLAEHDGPGTTFCFTACFERTTDDAAHLRNAVDSSVLYDSLSSIEPGREIAEAAVDLPRHARILLAEDSALIRRVARFQLEELQYGVDIVNNGEQAVAAVAAGDYELVLMDMRMPEMDGLEATRTIRTSERERGGHIVIIALTANALAEDREACIEAGMDDFLAKPLQLDALRAALERWMPAHSR
jgi:PAS domain S-box-containing protein